MDVVTMEHGSEADVRSQGQAAASPLPPDFLVGDWLVQPALGRVSRGASSQRLRPQLMDVLVCLAARNGRTVMKQEVMAAVWSDRFVTESALARTVAELRHALGDDAKQPRIIETIPKRGYRIIAPVAPTASSLEADRPRAVEPLPGAASAGPEGGFVRGARLVLVLVVLTLLIGIAWALSR
jgi:DNA-binding winged helix-turn-helix (wHTH) protein